MYNYGKMVNQRDNLARLTSFSFSSGKKLLNNFFLNYSGSVLDFGCGAGSFKPNSNTKYLGYDVDKRNKFASFHTLKDIVGAYDVIVFSHVIEHMEPKELDKTLKWAAKHGKTIIIVSPAANYFSLGSFFDDVTHVRPYSNPDFLFIVSKYFNVKRYTLCGVHSLNPIKLLCRLGLAYVFNSHIFTEFVLIAERK